MGLLELLGFRRAQTACGSRLLAMDTPRTESRAVTVSDTQRFRARQGTQFRCTAGTAWITNDRDCSDVVLHCGQSHRVAERATVWITGMPVCTVRVAVGQGNGSGLPSTKG